jgi:death-on-curing protein
MFGLIKNHPFHDANKRTALLVTLAFLQHNKYVVTLEQKRLDRFVVAIAENRLQRFFDGFSKADRKLVPSFKGVDPDTQVYQIADFLCRNSRKINHVTPLVTFNSLNNALKDHGFELVEPRGNYIDIVRWDPERRNIFGKVTPRRAVKLGQVGFPSWKTKLSRAAMKSIREATGLTSKNGCDSDVLFRGEEPLSSIISQYMEPLKRLAYK